MMKFKQFICATATIGILSTGAFLVQNHTASASSFNQNGLNLHDDSRLLDHELSYVDILTNKNTDPATKQQLKNYFAQKGLYSVSDIIKKAQKDGLDITKYQHLIK